MIRNVVIHLTNEQPLLADLFDAPKPTDTQLLCTNLRAMTGKRPVFADNSASLFVFPVGQIRFIELPPGSSRGTGGVSPTTSAGEPASSNGTAAEGDTELDLDEDFLRRVREA